MRFDVPAPVAAKARLAGATRWLDGLPDLVADLERKWSITVGRVYPDASEALVAEATQGDGTSAVLKVFVPRDGPASGHNEITALRLADGHGLARLYRSDPDLGAVLLERLGPSLHDLGLPLRRRHEILTDAAARVWRPAPDAGLPDGAQKARWLVEHITTTWPALDRPCAERTIEHALVCAQRRLAAHDDERAVLVHGDVHEWNALRSAEGRWVLVDPDGLLAEPAYDLGVIMREDPAELLRDGPHERAHWLAHRSGLDAAAIWEWGVVERVCTGLVCVSIGLEKVGRGMLDAADRIADVSPGRRDIPTR